MTTESEMRTDDRNDNDANRDPISGTPGSHPVGTGVGASGGALAGAAVGAVAGPIGTAIGLVAGAVAGGMVGKGIAETMDPAVEDEYWKKNFSKQDYVDHDSPYTIYEPAFRTGYEGRGQYPGKTFEDAEDNLKRDYERSRGEFSLGWERARPAIRDAWNRGGHATGVIVAGDKPGENEQP